MEGETDASIATQTKLWNERVLPNIDNNIKSGNSLIDTDFYDGELDFGDEKKIKPFNWQKAFPEVFAQGGFDAVIGNPPYVRVQLLNESKECLNYYSNKFKTAASGNYDIYVLFLEQALMILNEVGLVGYILPHKFLNSKYGIESRKLLSNGQHLKEIIHFGDKQIFHGATTYTCLLFLSNNKSKKFLFSKVDDLDSWINNKSAKSGFIESNSLNENEWNLSTGKEQELYKKLNLIETKLGDISKIFVGLQTSADTVFLFKDTKKASGKIVKVFSKELNEEVELETDLLKEVVRSGQIGRYWIYSTALILFPYILINDQAILISESNFISDYPLSWKYLNRNKKLLEGREKGKFKKLWWQYGRSQNLEMWEENKIMIPYMIKELSAYNDNSGKYFVNVTTGGFGLRLINLEFNLSYVTALLNSNLLNWYLKRVSTNFNSGYFAANKQFLVQLPICFDKINQNEIAKLSDQLKKLNEEKQTTKLQSKIEQIKSRIDYCEDKIDQAVYELYGLTEDEIRIVEGK